jgi:hypothetical protein
MFQYLKLRYVSVSFTEKIKLLTYTDYFEVNEPNPFCELSKIYQSNTWIINKISYNNLKYENEFNYHYLKIHTREIVIFILSLFAKFNNHRTSFHSQITLPKNHSITTVTNRNLSYFKLLYEILFIIHVLLWYILDNSQKGFGSLTSK